MTGIKQRQGFRSLKNIQFFMETYTTEGLNCNMNFNWFIENIAKDDGFKDAEEMFNWFHKRYDLSKPRRFAVYRWNNNAKV